MCGYKKIKIEYIMMAVAFASVVWSIFAGFRISRFQWLFVMGSVIWFLGMCRLLDQNKKYCSHGCDMYHILHACTQTADQWISDHQ